MTPEQRKRVAEILTGQKWKVVPWRPVNPEYNRDMIMLDGKAGWNQDREWSPDFKGEDWQRSQALAVVEKVSELIDHKFESYMVRGEWSKRLRVAINEKNIDGLCEMILELSDE